MKTEHRKRLEKAGFATALIVAVGFLHSKTPDFRRTAANSHSAVPQQRQLESTESPSGLDRSELSVQLERSVLAADLSMSDARNVLRSMDDAGRKAYGKLDSELAAASTRVRKSLAATRTAGPEQWESALAQFATDYEAYVQLISQAQRAASGTTQYGL